MSETPPSSLSFQALLDYIESKNFNHTSYPEEKRVTLSMSGKNANYRFTARITHDDGYLQVTANYPFNVREEKLRPSTAELITRANYCMPLGKFEMDMADGEVRFHLTHVIGEEGLTSEMIEKHFMTAYFTTDRYFPAFMQHIHAGYTPEDAIFHAELDLGAVYEFPLPTHGSKPLRKKSVLRDVIDSIEAPEPKYIFSQRAVEGVKKAKNNMKRALAQNLESQCLTITSHLAKVSINSRDPILLIDRDMEKYRRFTPREAARIQSFPDKFQFVGSEGDAYRQIGNAIAPVVMWHVFRKLVQTLNN